MNYVLSVSPGGGAGVAVTAIFSSPVSFSAGGSTTGCSPNPSSGPVTTVECPAAASTVTIQVAPQTAGALKIVAGLVGPDTDSDMTNNSAIATTTVTAGGGPPTNLAAVQTSDTQITVTWTASAGGADFYEVSRTETVGGIYTVLSPNPTVTSFVDASATRGHTYLYRARASKGGVWSGYSNNDPASLFTDFTINQYATSAKAAHVTELRTAIDMRRALAGLSAGNWIPVIAPGSTVISRGDIQQMRDLLDQAIGAGTYTDQPLTGYLPGQVLIKRIHIQELRNRVK